MKGWQLCRTSTVVTCSLVALAGCLLEPAGAQLQPDDTLGNEGSVVQTIDPLNAQITGGAQRGSNLFHSFSEFNVGDGRGVFFANPAGIENILSRVTGQNPSQIFGQLGVQGPANLFLLNPNGIVFGPNSSLDIQGSFHGTTASGINLGDIGLFSATAPQSSRLLSVAPGSLFFAQAAAQPESIINRGTLSAGKDLTLSGHNLDLQGQISAGENLTLTAQDTLKIRDSASTPFLAVAGGQLVTQGNQLVDLFALNHSESGLFSGQDLVLRSATPIAGDAHYFSGGNFSIEQLDGSLGALFSPHDPVIRASGNVFMDSFTGASLHIFAGGFVFIPGTITITDRESPDNAIIETVTLSDGTTLEIDGSAIPTLDIRAGTTAIGSPITEPGIATSADIFIGDIVIDSIFGTGGQVFLTNQYQPNLSLETLFDSITVGSIINQDFFGGGSVTIDTRNGITLDSIVDTSSISLAGSFFGNGGDIRLLSSGDIEINTSVFSRGLQGGNINIRTPNLISINSADIDVIASEGDSGNINIAAGQFISDLSEIDVSNETQGNAGNINILAQDSASFSGSFIRSNIGTGVMGNAGQIIVEANSVDINNGTQLQSGFFSGGQGASGLISITSENNLAIDNSAFFADSVSSLMASSSPIHISGNSIFITDSLLNSNTAGQGNAASISIESEHSLLISTTTIISRIASSGIGNGGDIRISSKAGSINISDSSINTSSDSVGNAGEIAIQSDGSISLEGSLFIADGLRSGTVTVLSEQGDISILASSVSSDSLPNNTISTIDMEPIMDPVSGSINFDSRSLFLRGGVLISTIAEGPNNAGAININATETIDAVSPSQDPDDFSNTILSRAELGATGSITGINITTKSLSLNDGSRITTTNLGGGATGPINIFAGDEIVLAGQDSIALASAITSRLAPEATGTAGQIVINTGSLRLEDGANIGTNRISTLNGVEVFDGDSGPIIINASNNISLRGTDSSGLGSRILTIAGFGLMSSPGGIEIRTGSLSLEDGAVIDASISTFGSGDSGSVMVVADDFITLSGADQFGFGSQISSQVLLGADGESSGIEITTVDLFLQDEAQITATSAGFGTAGNINVLATGQVSLESESGINASSQGPANAGNITIEMPTQFVATDSEISTTASQASGGAITIESQDIQLINSDIQTNVASGLGGGGDIALMSNSILAVGDSDILAFSQDGSGGNITLDAPVFIAENFSIIPSTNNLALLDENGVVNINATGALASGAIALPDNSFIEESLTELPQDPADPDALIANSCIVRTQAQQGNFVVTGAGGLAQRPGDAALGSFPTGTVKTIPPQFASTPRPWTLGDPIIEPQSVYRLPKGQLVISRDCSP